jgi:hypothetical protein
VRRRSPWRSLAHSGSHPDAGRSGCGQSISAQLVATHFGVTQLVPFVVAFASTRERGWESAVCATAIGAVFAIDRAARGAGHPKVDTRRAHLLALAVPVGYAVFCGAALTGALVVCTWSGLPARDVVSGFALGAQLEDWALGFGMTAVNAALVVPILMKAAPAIGSTTRRLRVKLLATVGLLSAVLFVESVLVGVVFRIPSHGNDGHASAPSSEALTDFEVERVRHPGR